MKLQIIVFQVFTVWICSLSQVFAQETFETSIFEDLRLYQDTAVFSWDTDRILYNQKQYLPFEYAEESETLEAYLYFGMDKQPAELKLLPSGDFEVVDSLLIVGDHARFKVRFKSLTASDFLKFVFSYKDDNSLNTHLVDINLFPYTKTYVNYYPADDQLFIGEEKVTRLITNRPDNIIVDNRWTNNLPINYRMEKRGNEILVFLDPNQLGRHRVILPIALRRPTIDANGAILYALDPITYDFNIKSGRLAFLTLDEQEVTPHDDLKTPIEVQIQNHRNLQIGKTYRIENQEEKGGALVAELFTKSRLNNDQVLCLLRPYAHHLKSEGYLYIKEADVPRFVTNVDITPKTSIQAIYLQREGEDWEKTNVVHPGENLKVRIEGEALHKAQFSFPGIVNLQYDSLIRNQKIALFDIKVPLDIISNKIEIFDQSQNTGKYLSVEEFQRPRAFDFVAIELAGNQSYVVSEIDKPIYFDGSLTDLVLAFDKSKIDAGNKLYGKQYVKVDVKVSNKSGNLIEIYKFDELVITPDETAIRYANYKDANALTSGLNLNNYLSRKTYDLEEWSRIELQISHVKTRYSEPVQRKKITIYLRRKYNFDIDVSFPGGLLILKKDANNDGSKGRAFSNFSGVSFAMLAQFSFYKPGKIAKYEPYKIGAGFIAIDAFNFSENATNRDVGLVVIGSLYPTGSANKKLTFPLYAGFGYLMKEGKPFSLIGPGIRVRF